MASQPRGVAVISGGGTGIGREMALELARRGFDLAVLGRREEPLRQTLEESGADGLALVCDVRDASAVARASDQIHQRWEAAEVVVPAAGVAHIAPLDVLTPDAFAETVDVNLTGTALLIQSLLPAMKRQGRGWIFPILSVAARKGFPGWSAYCASKWGLAGLVAALREELSGSGIPGVRITALYPGATDTPIWDNAPGNWNRAAMIPAREVARALAYALDSDPSTLVEEIHLGPAGGAL
jgi:NAD(P)-dependent dehydrogenase (short-subunit alcohol dehydrogenase family)